MIPLANLFLGALTILALVAAIGGVILAQSDP